MTRHDPVSVVLAAVPTATRPLRHPGRASRALVTVPPWKAPQVDPTPTATEKWRSLAACRGSDVGLFYPDGTTPNDLIRLTCATCDVRAECLTDAVAHRETFGLWGGAAGDTLRKLTRKFTKRSHADPSILDDCECEWCKGARAHFNALDEMRFSETERYRSPFPPDLGNRTHGHASTYGVGCRCEPCRLAKAYEDNMRRTA